MIYNEKNIFEDSPASADNYRKDYTKGIENYIERIKNESKNIRQSFMPPDELVKNPDKFRKIYRESYIFR